MDLNDTVRVTLTAKGAEIINAENKEIADKVKSVYFKHDYKEGDHYQGPLHEVMCLFGGRYCAPGGAKTFTELTLISKNS